MKRRGTMQIRNPHFNSSLRLMIFQLRKSLSRNKERKIFYRHFFFLGRDSNHRPTRPQANMPPFVHTDFLLLRMLLDDVPKDEFNVNVGFT